MKTKNLRLKAKGFIMLCFFLVTASTSIFAQEKTVTGKVVDSNGEAIPGINVIVKGTTQGTITDIDGNYLVSNISNDNILVFSFVGMTTQEVAVGSQSTINVVMQDDALGLEEVVVVGFGTQKKATMTGAVTQVKGEEMIKGKGTSSAALALQGEVPGLVVTRGSSRPGNEGMDLKIRGDFSVNGRGPLILVDGLEVPEWQLNTMNSNDIETYSVIKDGAAAIFGTKAAGGVILITTKKGKKGKMKVDYSGEYQVNIPGEFPLMDLDEYIDFLYTIGSNDNFQYINGTTGEWEESAFSTTFFTKDEMEQYMAGTFPLAPDSYFTLGQEHRFANVDQSKLVYGNTISQRHNIAVSGGGDKATYRTSLGFANERSPIEFVYDGAKKYNFRTNVTYDVNDMISTDFNVSYDNRLIDEPSEGVGEGLQNPPMYPVYNEFGQYYGLWEANMLAELDEGGRTKTNQEIIRLGGTLNLDLDKYIQGLSFTYKANIRSQSSDKTIRYTGVDYYKWDGSFDRTIYHDSNNSSVNVNLSKTLFQNHVVQTNYKRSFGDHNLGAMVGMSAEVTDYSQYNMFRGNMLSDELDDLNTGDPATQTNAGTSNDNDYDSESYGTGLVSYITRLNYDYKGIYLMELMGRRDGSSKLHPDERWKNFYGASVGVRLSEMGFLKDGVFNNLKLRFSYGETGSTSGINNYDYVSTINSSGEAYFGNSATIYPTAYISAMTSTDRTWERIANTNFALDYAVLNDRLSGSLEYYIRKNDDMLISITYPEVLGATAPKTNSGAFENKGWEISANWRDKIGELKYNVGVAVWDSKSELTRMDGATTIEGGVNKTVVGKPLYSIYAYETDGLFQTEEEILDYYDKYGFDHTTAEPYDNKEGTNLLQYASDQRLIPGSAKVVDSNGDGYINEDDLVYQGDTNPHYSYSINLGLAYKGFDFSAFFQGVGEQQYIREGRLAYPNSSWWTNQNSTFIGKTWTTTNTDADLPIVNGRRKGELKAWNWSNINDYRIVNASYLRAKMITVGYSLPQSLLSKVALERVRFSVTGNDLFTFSNVKDGLDPENGSEASHGTVPFTSSIIFGVDVTF